jgi:hypothetical protein
MNKTTPNQSTQRIIGFVRYSCRADFGGKRNYFFLQPEYLDYRLNIFRNVTLKCFQEQSDKDFIIFLLHSADLPQHYKDIFQNIEENNAFLHNLYLSDSEAENLGSVISTKTVEYINYNDVFISFRIDNDDALPCDYISRIKYYLKPEFAGHVISLPQIKIIQRTNKNKFIVKVINHYFNSMGMAYVSNRDINETIMHLGLHDKVYLKYPTILLSGGGGLQTINGRNVANEIPLGRVSRYNDDTLRVFLKKNNYPDIDFKCLHICKRNILATIIKIFFKTLKKLILK